MQARWTLLHRRMLYIICDARYSSHFIYDLLSNCMFTFPYIGHNSCRPYANLVKYIYLWGIQVILTNVSHFLAISVAGLFADVKTAKMSRKQLEMTKRAHSLQILIRGQALHWHGLINLFLKPDEREAVRPRVQCLSCGWYARNHCENLLGSPLIFILFRLGLVRQ